ncbi:serine hydrolase [uncultured Roseibium sp.]|uniref:serine hydrolase n=1 Tax=uncultured Roseibium sp. TaxID=1936171 RepID=UPI00259ACBCE|nr:serine hydrolase [uncultured Roseibium sp.]
MMKRCLVLPVTLLLYALSALSVGATSSMSDATFLRNLWNEQAVTANDLSPLFLKAVPLEELQELSRQFKADYGEATSVVPGATAGEFNLRTATHDVLITLGRGGDGTITSLLIKQIQVRASPKELLSRLADFGHDHGHLLLRNGKVISQASAQTDLAIGSGFKIFVLQQLEDGINAGLTGWDTILILEPRHKSLPSGTLQNWPDGHRLTVETAALLMISQSDNTATDLVMDHLAELPAHRPGGNKALLTTRQFFQLKADPILAAEFSSASAETRRELLERLSKAELPSVDAVSRPYQPGVEWYASPEDLCAALDRIAHLPAVTANPGFALEDDWHSAAFKGGSEIGVLNHTYVLDEADGTRWCFSATWNQTEPLDETAIHAALGTLLARLPELAE